MVRLMLISLMALVVMGFAPISQSNYQVQDINVTNDVSEYAAVTTAKQARKKIKKRLKRKKCSLARKGTVKKQKACVRKKLKRLDPDKDGIVKKKDNCPDVANFSQTNSDTDTHGDECDNCPALANEDQADVNVNGVGNACEVENNQSN
ncbi:MAG: thrombospondin type 3 repeat-containing protein [Bdellovibrionota bacterium]